MTTLVQPVALEHVQSRLERTAAILERRGYAVTSARLGEMCVGGAVEEHEVVSALRDSSKVRLRDGLVLPHALVPAASSIRGRAAAHEPNATGCMPLALAFVRSLVRLSPYVLSVSIAGSLASGGYLLSDDVDLNFIVEDGHRHIAYVALNALGLLHSFRHRRRPVDTHTRRPLAPRFMTANLILERSQCFPLQRQDEDMAYEFVASEPVYGLAFWWEVVTANPGLSSHFPQLETRRFNSAMRVSPALPSWVYPSAIDTLACKVGRAGWRYMQWTRRKRPEALARVAFVRQTMQPYALFDES